MNEKLRKMMETRGGLIAGMRAVVDKADAEERGMTAEENESYEKMERDLTALDARIETERKLSERESDQRESFNGGSGNPNRNPIGGERREGTASEEYRSAFEGYTRGNGNFERRALQIGTDSEGGYLAPDEFEKRLIDTTTEESVMRGLAEVMTSGSGSRTIPMVASHGSAAWMDEEAAFTESDDSFTTITMGAHKLGTIIKVSEEMLNDAFLNVESYIAREFGRRLGATEDEAFITGNGTGKPMGVVGSAQTGVTTAAAAAVTADEVIDLIYSLKPQYRRRAVFLMNDSTVKLIRKLKGGDGQYLWQPSMQASQPDRLFSYPVRTSTNMAAVAASAKAMAFGDFKHYRILDRQGVHFQRLNELYAANGQVGFRAWKRTEGKLLVAEAVKLLVCRS